MKRKYTKSIDGVYRCTINIPIRLTQEEVKFLEDNYQEHNCKSPKDYLSLLIELCQDWRHTINGIGD